MIIETCCDSITAMYAAVIAGTDRIELCNDLSVGGVTPHHADIDEAGTLKGLKVNVLIRPRGGSFVYHESEIERMFYKIAYCANCGLNGVVSGALKQDGTVDMELCRELARRFNPSEADIEKKIRMAYARVQVFCLIPEHITAKRVHEA